MPAPENTGEENPFGLSIGDLMAALLLIFILLLGATLLLLKEQEQETVDLISSYQALKDSLYADLRQEFKGDLERWNAEIDSANLVIRFQEPEVLFEYGESEVRPRFRTILSDFFPRYIRILRRPKYRGSIEEIRIEGHTSKFWSEQATEEEAYFNNMQLSQDRTRSVLRLALGTITSPRVQEWTRNHLTANGLSSSQPILTADGTRDPEASRRVEFRVRTDAEERLRKIVNQIANSNTSTPAQSTVKDAEG